MKLIIVILWIILIIISIIKIIIWQKNLSGVVVKASLVTQGSTHMEGGMTLISAVALCFILVSHLLVHRVKLAYVPHLVSHFELNLN